MTAEKQFLESLFPGPRNFAVRIGPAVVLDSTSPPEFTLVLRNAGVLRNIFRPPVETSLGNAFIHGDLEVEGDVTRVFPVVDACREAARSPRRLMKLVRLWRALPPPPEPAPASAAREEPALRGSRHSEERDREAVAYHYDLGNDFFALFLDSRMIYSCAYFRDRDQDLESAQLYKLDQICRKLQLRPGERLLDIGCGWGGLLIYAAQHFDIQGVGITLSERQLDLATQRVSEAGLSGRISIELLDYRKLGDDTFDKISSVGMFEHVGQARMQDYFAKLCTILEPGGLLLNHGISREATAPQKTLATKLLDPLNHLVVGTSPITRYVFPDSELIPLSEVNIAGEKAGLEVRDVENLREHYALTLRHWIKNLEAHEAEAVRIVGAPTYRVWRLYFAASAYRFDIGRISVNQTLFARLDNGRAGVPLSRAELYS